MKKLKFKCTLLSDVILNMKSATTGPNETLDFIPGSNFLGIAASSLYPQLTPEEALVLFHSGKVRFGDAHPSQHGIRGLRVPASMYYPKLSSPEKELYIHHLIPKDKDMSGMQLKQCRSGFYTFSGKSGSDGKPVPGEQVRTFTDFAIKSAYDRNARRSKDEQLFGYQSLRKGLTMYFSVEIDDSVAYLAGKIKDALENGTRIGRSRSAQYGLVKIEPAEFLEEEGGKPLKENSEDMVAVYADSRLIFFDDEFGMPTFQPTAEQLGLNGEIDWKKSQIRTFRYAPWNFKRQCFDTDRCGIEKGSVIVVRLKEGFTPDLHSRAVGSYLNEGFGHVIYNPSFLAGDSEGNAVTRLVSPEPIDSHTPMDSQTTLISFLKAKKAEEAQTDKIIAMVNKWVETNVLKFSKGEYSSQWGFIRSLAASAISFEELKEDLFSIDPDPTGYLVHGVAKDKWKGERFESLKEFFDTLQVDRGISDSVARMAIVNLASEMAKKCK